MKEPNPESPQTPSKSTEPSKKREPPLKTKQLITAIYCMGYIAMGLEIASVGPTLLELSRRTNTDVAFLGLLITSRAVGYVFGSFLGPFYDKFPGHRMLSTMLFAAGGVCFFYPFIYDIYILGIVFFFHGLAMGAIDTGGNVLLIYLFKNGGVEPYMQTLHFSFGVGACASPLFFGFIMDANGGSYNIAFIISGILFFPIAIALFFFDSPIPKPKEEKQDGKSNFDEYLIITYIATILFLINGAEITMSSYLETYTVKMGIGSEQLGYTITFSFWLAFTIGRALAIPLSTILAPKEMILSNLIGIFISTFLILMNPTSLMWVWGGSVGIGLFIASSFPSSYTYAESMINITGWITTIFVVGASFGEMFFPLIIGLAFDTNMGYLSVFYGEITIVSYCLIAMGVLHIIGVKRIKPEDIKFD